MTRLASLGVRLLTLIEIVTRRHLEAQGKTLPGLYLDIRNRRTAKPTAKRLLRAFRGINCMRAPDQVTSCTTPLDRFTTGDSLNTLYQRVRLPN